MISAPSPIACVLDAQADLEVVERLREEIIRAEPEAASASVSIVLAGHDEYGHATTAPSQSREHREPVHVGHAEVEDHQVRRVLAQQAGHLLRLAVRHRAREFP